MLEETSFMGSFNEGWEKHYVWKDIIKVIVNMRQIADIFN